MSKLRDSKYSWVTKACQLSALSAVLLLAGCDSVDSLKPQPNLGVDPSDQKQNKDKDKSKEKDKEAVTVGDRKIAKLKITDITLIDASNDQPTSYITTDGAKAKVKITDEKGKAIEGAKVTFSADGIELKPSNGAVLTNAEGEATVFLAPTNGEDAGAYTMSASAEYYGLTVASNPFNYSLQALDINFEGLQVAEKTLESGASTLVSVVTKNANTGRYQNKVKVNFSATCGTFEQADVISSSQGNVENTYKSIDEKGELCEGEHAITITSNGGVIGTTKVRIKDIKANSILYSSDDVSLGTKNSGAAGTGKIEFTVYSNGIPVTNQEVELQLIKAPGDFSFVLNGNRDKRILKSDSSGKVSVSLYPGNIPGPVEVKASLVIDRKINALSRNVAIATGRPIQGGITLAVGKNVLLKNKVDSTPIEALLTDRQGNLVPDGTTVSFVSEGGTVTPNCSTKDGRCSVTFTSQNPQPLDGRVSVLAYAEGEKAYIDINGDNVYNRGDKLRNNIGSFYRDDNENMRYDADNNEFLYKRPREGRRSRCGTAPFFEPNIPGSCDSGLDTVVRHQIVIGFANDTPTIIEKGIGITKALVKVEYDASTGLIKSETFKSAGSYRFEMYGNEVKTVPMPSGTTVSVSSEDRTDNKMSCNAKLEKGITPVSNTMFMGRISEVRGKKVNTFTDSRYVNYGIALDNCDIGDKIRIRVVAPNGTITTRTRLISRDDLIRDRSDDILIVDTAKAIKDAEQLAQAARDLEAKARAARSNAVEKKKIVKEKEDFATIATDKPAAEDDVKKAKLEAKKAENEAIEAEKIAEEAKEKAIEASKKAKEKQEELKRARQSR